MADRSIERGRLRQSRLWCSQLCRKSKSSFFYSFSLLDRPRRDAMLALYAFARITDDLGDSTEPINVRAAKLAGWRELLGMQITGAHLTNSYTALRLPICPPSASANPTFGDQLPAVEESLRQFAPLWPALQDCVRRYNVPPKLLEDIVQGVTMDLDHRHPASWDDLNHYCYHVASAVGLACVYIWRDQEIVPEKEVPIQPAIDCGVAFQLTNILRDIAEDARMGRVYLPLSELRTFDVDLERWLHGEPDGRWQDLVAHIAQEARKRYRSGWHTIDFLTPQSQRMFSLMWRSYRGLLEQVVDCTDQLWGEHKIRLPNRQRWSLFTSHAFPPFYSRLPAP